LLTARFQGDQNYEAASDSTSVTVGGANPHPVSVTVQCASGTQQSSPLNINSNDSTRCTATVQDTSPPDGNNNPTRITPTGTLSWTPSAEYGAGGFANNTCTLSKVDDQTAACPAAGVTYTPTSIGNPPSPYIDTQHIVAMYNGDTVHMSTSSPPTSIYVTDQHPAEVQVTCATTPAAPVILGGGLPATAQCVVQVKDTVSGRPSIAPTGSVTWTGPTGVPGAVGTITASPCQLQPVDTATAQCAPITYQPTAAGANPVNAHQLTASYAGDPLHPGPSTGTATVYVA